MKEQREKFDRFLQLCEDYQTAKAAFTAAEQGAKAIADAVAERIGADKKQTAERVAELEGLMMDGSRPASARRVWASELDRLKARTFCATPDDVAAFNGEMEAAVEAVSDINRLQREIRAAISSVEAEIKALRAQTLGDPATGLWENRLDGVRKSFKLICREMGA